MAQISNRYNGSISDEWWLAGILTPFRLIDAHIRWPAYTLEVGAGTNA